MNLRPSGYEPDELPGCSTPRQRGVWTSCRENRDHDQAQLLARPGGDPLSHRSNGSTLGAARFHGRVRNGVGWDPRALTTRSSEELCVTDKEWAWDASPRFPAPRRLAGGGRRVAGWRPSACLSPSISGLSAFGLLEPARLGLDVGSLAFERLGPVSCTCYHASTSGLSTWWSTTALDETWF